MKYGVFDSTGTLLKRFNTWKQAFTFKITNCRYDWAIKQVYIK